MAGGRNFKNRKIAMFQQRFDQSTRNFAQYDALTYEPYA